MGENYFYEDCITDRNRVVLYGKYFARKELSEKDMFEDQSSGQNSYRGNQPPRDLAVLMETLEAQEKEEDQPSLSLLKLSS